MKKFFWKVGQRLMLFYDKDIVWHCSNCGLLPSDYNKYMEDNPRYCPQCGARIV